MSTLSHVDSKGAARMVDVSDKVASWREAAAAAVLHAEPRVIAAAKSGQTPKGAVFETARIAGIMAAKRTSELIPLCHPLPLTHLAIDFQVGDDTVRIVSTAKTHGVTGVEMEALTAATVAALTLYDMLKALSKSMTIDGVRLLRKSGGKSGEYTATEIGDE